MFKIAFKTTAVQLFHNLRGLTLVLTVLVLALSFLGINGLEVPIWGGYFTLYAVKYINRYEDRICYIPVSYTHLDVYKRQMYTCFWPEIHRQMLPINFFLF